MRPNPQETADLVTFTKEILSGKPHFFVQCRILWTLRCVSVKVYVILLIL